MGLRRSFRKRIELIAAKAIFTILLLLAGFFLPWWLTLILALLIALTDMLIVELVIIGMVLDLLLISSATLSLGNLFFTLCFFLIALGVLTFQSSSK